MNLLPRLPGPVADRLLEQMLGRESFRWPGFAAEALPEGVRYAATGGSIASASQLRAIRQGMMELASGHGFGAPDRKDNPAGFDAALAEWLAERPEFASGEGLRDDVWCFMAVILAPDIVHWRFGNSRERYLGGVRNAFQRLWMRAKALDRGPKREDRWALLYHLSEDALVQITERPSIGADPVLARELAEGWLRTSERIGKQRMEPVMRLATLRLRMRNEIQSLSDLPSDRLAGLIDEFFEKASRRAAVERGHPIRQAKISAGSVDEEVDSPEESSRTRKSSWAIWRAR